MMAKVEKLWKNPNQNFDCVVYLKMKNILENILEYTGISENNWVATMTNDQNLLTYDLVRKLDGCAERHAPTQKLTPKEIKLTLKPCITPDIQN